MIAVPDGQLLEAVGGVVNLDKFYAFWTMETLVGHWDGYTGNTNNFYFYRHPDSGLVEFVPWGADALFRRRFTPFDSVQARGALTRRLYFHPQSQAANFAKLSETRG